MSTPVHQSYNAFSEDIEGNISDHFQKKFAIKIESQQFFILWELLSDL